MQRSSRPGRRPRPASPKTQAIVDVGLHDGATAPYEPINGEQAQQLIDSALVLMRDSGVAFEPGSEALSILKAASCTASDDGVVRFQPERVRDALDSVAKSVRLWDRSGTHGIDLDCHHTWFIPGMTCIRVYDLESGEPRDSTGEDLATVTRVADALPNIDAVCIACKNVARSDIHGEIEEFSIMAANTSKPLEYLCEQPRSLGAAIEMAAAIRGGSQELFDKPYFLQLVTPLPLNYHAIHTDQLIQAVRAGIPVSVGTLPIGGASTPITTAGSIVNSLATDFAAMVLAQIVRRGSFCIGSSDVCFMEPATGSIGNFAQTSLADLIMCQVRRRLGLPSFTGAAGYSSSARFNQDAVAELTAGMLQSFFSRPATLDYLGSLDQGLTYSLHGLLLCHDLAGLLRTMWEGVQIDESTLALDLARTVGPRGNYLAHQHTADHCREHLWQSRYFGARMPLGSADTDLEMRIDSDLRQILESHHPQPLGAELTARLAAIRERFALSHSA
ncbi:MAG TPA: trimethylamine methyltransferase family protein [Steroidobacteraceae bacterium]|nr:trimethylamine methyltransferase family protein [Steroidobacteraceae bacterium]